MASYDTSAPNPNWSTMLLTFEKVMSVISSKFPTTPILPAIGNNDCYYHDLAPEPGQNSTMYYGELYEIFFANISANSALAASIEPTWMIGGYYSYQLTDSLMLITLNGIYPFTSNYVQSNNGTTLMLEWLNATLAANPNMKFMT